MLLDMTLENCEWGNLEIEIYYSKTQTSSEQKYNKEALMPSIPELKLTLRDRLIRDIRQLPDEILKDAYHIELIERKVLMQHDDYLATQYRNFRDLSPDADFMTFKMGSWSIKMETPENNN